MLVVVLIGARANTVQDLPVLVARAMVADGRARWPEGSPHAPAVPSPVSSTPAARVSTAAPRAKRGRR